MRTTPAENGELGRILAQKVSAATGPVAIVLPLRGVSAIDQDGSAISKRVVAALTGSPAEGAH